MADEKTFATTTLNDFYVSAMGDMWQRQQDTWKCMNRQRLLHEQPTPLDAPVYEQLSREMLHEDYGNGKPLETFIQQLRNIAAKAPPNCPVFVAIDEEGDYEGGSYMFLRVGCERPPTRKEIKAREERNAQIAEVKEEAKAKAATEERAEYERLKAKFGG